MDTVISGCFENDEALCDEVMYFLRAGSCAEESVCCVWWELAVVDEVHCVCC